jgi:predicted esterase
MESYVSPIDGSSQPFGLYIPQGFDPNVPHPVVVYGHWAPGRADASFPMASYADANGWILVNVDARGDYTMYFGVAELDTLHVLDELRARYPTGIDENRIYFEGGSTGADGAYRLGFRYPHVFAAVAGVDGRTDCHVFYRNVFAPRSDLDLVERLQEPLIQSLSALYIAENGKNLNLYMVVDTNDTTIPPEQGRSLHTRLGELGYAHSYRENAGGHLAGYSKPDIYQFLSQKVKDPNPKRVVLKANQLQFGFLHWVRIDRLEKTAQFATIEATVSGKVKGRVDVTANNLLQYTLSLTAEILEQNEASIYTDGQLTYAGPVGDITVFASLDACGNITGWSTSDTLPRRLRKTARVEGPIGHAYESKFLLVKGTVGSKGENSENASQATAFASDWNSVLHASIAPVTDSSITDDDIATSNLILFGTADSNSLIKSVNDQLPVRIWRDRIVAGAMEYQGSNYGLYMVFPNPLNPDKYVVISHGTIQGSFDEMVVVLAWYWPDYVVFRTDVIPRPAGTIPTGKQVRYLPDAWVEAGFFDQYWRLDKDEDGVDDIFEKEIIDADPDDPYVTIEDINPQDDFDGDGQDNRTEYNAGTNPTAPDSLFSVASVSPDAADPMSFQVSWKVAAGRSYYILWSDSMDGPWQEITQLDPADISDDGDIRTWTDKGTDPAMEGKKPGDSPARFYKLAAYR